MVKDNSTDDSCVCELNGYRLYDGGLSSRPSYLRASPFGGFRLLPQVRLWVEKEASAVSMTLV